MKKCARCNNEYPLDNFPKQKSYCFPCNRIKMNEYARKRKDKRKQYNIENRKSISEYNKKYYTDNKEMFQENYKKYLKENINFRITHNLRVRINDALKNNYKNTSSTDLLGCSLDEYRNYLESKFDDKMTWENYGKGNYWEIDHIKPCSSFDLSNEEEQKKCFHYTNTQPLPIIENQIKNRF